MIPDIVTQIESKIGKPLTRLTGLKELADGVRHQHNNSYALNNGKLVLLNVSQTELLDQAAFNREECASLQYLNLSENKNLAALSWDVPLSNLRYLDLSECKLGKLTLPEGCDLLETAWLQKSGLKSLRFAGPCPRLQFLDVSENRLKELTLPFGFDSLVHLYLVNNELEQVVFQVEKQETLESPLANLQTLHLGDNRLAKVPENIIFSKALTALYLGGNTPKNIPRLFLGEHSRFGSHNSLQEARIWFDELKNFPGQKNKAVKLMLTGNGNVGKSTLACSMRNGSCEHDHETTHGIRIETLEGDNITYNIWDFGGQEVYHGTHRLFIESAALQVMLFDAETEQCAREFSLEQDRVSDEQIRPHPLEYWYETTKKLSPDSVYFFVQNNKRPGEPVDQKINSYALGRAKYISLNAKTGEDVDELLFSLEKNARKLPDFDMTMPESWLKVRQFFIDNLKVRDNKKIISKGDYEDLCKTHKVMEKARPLLFRYLHRNGYLFHHPNLGDNIIADQRWALQAIYKPYDRKADHYKVFRDLEGKIRVFLLFNIFGDAYTEDEKWLFLEFMTSCGLCFQLNNRPWQEDKSKSDVYVFPEFLPPTRPGDVALLWKNRAKEVCTLRYQLPWLNYSVIQTFITALGRKTATHNLWRYGIHVVTDEGWFKVELDYEQKALILQIDKCAMAKWLKAILEELHFDHGRVGWEISADGISYSQFDLAEWQEHDQHKHAEQRIEMAGRKEDQGLSAKLPDMEQRFDRQVILFLAANPTSIKLSCRIENSHIIEKLSDSKIKDRPEHWAKFDVSPDKMIDYLNEFRPTIVHFCTHGEQVNDLTKKGGGLILHRDDFQGSKMLDAERLSEIFRQIKKKNSEMRIVFLNACYSKPQAMAISKHDLYVFGVSDQLVSPEARLFAAGFYRQYAMTLDIQEAVRTALMYGTTENPDIGKLFHLFYKGQEIAIDS